MTPPSSRGCATCGRNIGLCSCPPGEDEVGEGPIRRRRARSDAPTPPRPPRHPAEAEHLGARLGREDAPPSLESLAPFAEYDRRRAVEKRWELEAKAKLGLCGRGADAIPGAGAGRRFWVGGSVEFAAGGTRGRTMHDAAKAGDASAVARRLSRGEHPDQGDFLAQTCLMLAAAEGCASLERNGFVTAFSREKKRTPSARDPSPPPPASLTLLGLPPLALLSAGTSSSSRRYSTAARRRTRGT
jgi:hypothetical protein